MRRAARDIGAGARANALEARRIWSDEAGWMARGRSVF